jgi:paraquat-inducible protein A
MLPANLFPTITLEIYGEKDSGWLLEGALVLAQEEYHAVGILIATTIFAVPLLQYLLILIVSSCIMFRYSPAPLPYLIRTLKAIHEWGMLEVYLLSLAVSLIKLRDFATVLFEPGFFALMALLINTLILLKVIDYDALWEQIDAS